MQLSKIKVDQTKIMKYFNLHTFPGNHHYSCKNDIFTTFSEAEIFNSIANKIHVIVTGSVQNQFIFILFANVRYFPQKKIFSAKIYFVFITFGFTDILLHCPAQ
jgi:hypothetical protein